MSYFLQPSTVNQFIQNESLRAELYKIGELLIQYDKESKHMYTYEYSKSGYVSKIENTQQINKVNSILFEIDQIMKQKLVNIYSGFLSNDVSGNMAKRDIYQLARKIYRDSAKY